MSATNDPGEPGESIARGHGVEPRGLLDVPHSSLYEGFFGRMFRTLPPFAPADADLVKLAREMFEVEDLEEETDGRNNETITAGYTYLGQFVDHDITFDPTSKLQRENDPNALRDFRTPRLDLDSVYGAGPADEPFLYDPDGIKLRIGETTYCEPDLPRIALSDAERSEEKRQGRRALIGDPRNDENVIISQLHLGFMAFHNAVVDALKDNVPIFRLFEDAQRTVRWHYQWLLVNDFLPRIVGQETVDAVLGWEEYAVGTARSKRGERLRRPATGWVPKPNLHFYTWRNQPFVPVEFAAAAFRFGHSMVRSDYTLNDRTTGKNEIKLFADATKREDTEDDLHGFRERPRRMTIEWPRFFQFQDVPRDESTPQPSRNIDTKLTFRLSLLPPSLIGRTDPVLSRSVQALAGPGRFDDSLVGMLLPARNLLRGKALGLPTGQAVAYAMGLPDEQILDRHNFRDLKDHDLIRAFGHHTPLWYYILKEAEVLNRGERLGPVGGRIVTEVLIGLLYGDRLSYLRSDPLWQPTPGEFGARQGPSDDQPVFGIPELLGFPRQPSLPTDRTRSRPIGAGPRGHRRAPSWARRYALRKESIVDRQTYDDLDMSIPIDRTRLKDMIDPLATRLVLDMPNVFLKRFVLNNGRPVRAADRVGAFLFYVEQVPANGGCVKLRLRPNPAEPDTIRLSTLYYKSQSSPPSPLERGDPNGVDKVYELAEGDAVLLINEKFELWCPDFAGATVLMAGLAPAQNCGSSPCP
jgi:hypothetical protein